jgi:hypothetical protein
LRVCATCRAEYERDEKSHARKAYRTEPHLTDLHNWLVLSIGDLRAALSFDRTRRGPNVYPLKVP